MRRHIDEPLSLGGILSSAVESANAYCVGRNLQCAVGGLIARHLRGSTVRARVEHAYGKRAQLALRAQNRRQQLRLGASFKAQ
jgi:hypothetical protein